jgi:hypothetical protein
MNEDFLITEERLNSIADSFGITRESVKQLHNKFCLIEDQIKNHRLAHISRVLEAEIKQKKMNPQFIIEYVPYAVKTLRRRGSMSIRWPDKFTIYYDDTLPEKDIRVNVSHELGHLYLSECYKTSADANEAASLKFEKTTEPLSTIFGIFIVSNKNHFYNNLDTFAHRHDDWDSILEDFKNLSS